MATKEVVVRVRCSERERTVWGRSADAVGESLSEWIRGRLNSPAEPVFPELEPLEGRGLPMEVPAEVAAPLIAEGKEAVERLRALELPGGPAREPQVELLKENDAEREQMIAEGWDPRGFVVPAPSKKTFRPDFK